MPEPRRPPLRRLLLAVLVASLVAGPAAAPVAATEPDPSPTAPAPPSSEPTPAGGESPTPSVAPADGTPIPEHTASPEPSGAEDPTPSADRGQTAMPSDAPTPSVEPSASPTATASPDPTAPPSPVWPGRMNLFRSRAWVRQYTDYTCTAASTQTMLNLILDRSDRSLLLQLRIIRYARRHDSLPSSRGSDPLGWSRAMTYFGGGRYEWRTFSSRVEALRHAARRLATTGKPVGLLVWRGRHAWTMTGFTSTTDPRTDPAATITGIYVAPPLVGVDPRPNSYVPAGSLWTFARYQERDGLRTWVGRWVVVAP